MNEWLKKVTAKIKDLWSKWKPIQKVILIGILIVVIVVIIAAARVSSKPSMIKLFSAPVTDATNLAKILDKLDENNIDVNESEGYIFVADKKTKLRANALLNDLGLIPSNVNIWDDYFDRSWSTTDADQNVKLQLKKQQELKAFIESYPEIERASVSIVLPEDKLLVEDQNPVTCSIILTARGNSGILQDTKRIKGIHNAVLAAVEGLKEEYLIITDEEGNQINDFASLAEIDRVNIVARQQRLILKRETEIRAKILKALQNTYTEDRCRDMVVSVQMDMSKKEKDSTEYGGIEITPDNPDTPWDDSVKRDYLPVSQQTVTNEWTGTGYNPEGPGGTEGNNPPVHSDMSNVIGHSVQTGVTENNVMNTYVTHEEVSPQIDRVTATVNIDGINKLVRDPETGKYKVDEEGLRERKYFPLTPEQISDAEKLIKGAIGYNRERGDLVFVTNTAYDRRSEWQEEDAAYFAKEQRAKTLIIILVSIVVILFGFILFRIINKEIERRRREREARLLAEQQAARERALWDAKDEGMEVTMSVEETRRMELQENAITMAKEHPEDVAMLIRTWLMEE